MVRSPVSLRVVDGGWSSSVETFRGTAGPITPVECRDKKGLVDFNLVDLSLSIYPFPFVQGTIATLEKRE